MQENVMSFVNISPLFIAIIIGFVFSFNENTSIKIPAIVVIASTIISFLFPIFNLKSWVTYPAIISESAMFVLAARLLSKKTENVAGLDFGSCHRFCLGDWTVYFSRSDF